MRRSRVLVVLAGATLAGGLVTACQNIPADASQADFCNAGEKFSALDKVTFAQGQKAIDHLAEVGTPSDIGDSARSGFVELIKRMQDADDAEEFRSSTRSMDASERKHLLALDTYIQATCADKVPLSATPATFCQAGAAFATAQSGADFSAVRTTIKKLAATGTPESIDASAREGFLELIERVENAYDATDLEQRTAGMTQEQRTRLADLDAFIKKTCS